MLEKVNIDKNQVKADYLSGMKNKEIAEKYNLSLNTLKSWIKRYKWSEEKNKGAPKRRKRGAPFNNKNAVGAGAPKKNDNAVKHGLFSKYLPKESMDIIDSMAEKSPLDLIWDAIQIQYAAIIRAQQIMYVRDRDDLTTTQIQEKNGDSVTEERWEVQQAWDKQGSFLKAQARAQSELRSMIRQYKDLAERVGGKQEAIDRLDEILKGVRENAAKQEAE